MRRTKIVCTIGPASESIETLVKLIEAGMNVARLNFSHGSHEEHKARITRIREASKKTGKIVAILLDTKGPEIRTHNMENDAIELVPGNKLTISVQEVVGTPHIISVTYPDFANDVQVGSRVLLDDGLIELQVESIDINKQEVVTKIINGNILKNKKGVNLPGVSVNLPGITEKDKADILFGIKENIDFIAASFVRRAEDILEIKDFLKHHNGEYIQIIPKIENEEGMNNIDEILEASDGLMVARGDLGVEIPPEDVPIAQKTMIRKCNQIAKPVITATQMLDSMQRNPRPTRAEASDVANAILDGTDAIMLSGETAAGNYPVESVQTMDKIARKTETVLNYKKILRDRANDHEPNVTDSIGQSVAYSALNLQVQALIASTKSGMTAKIISRYRPETQIIAVTTTDRVARQLTLVWGVTPLIGTVFNSTDEVLIQPIKQCVAENYIKSGDLIIITAGLPTYNEGTTNCMKIHCVE